MQFLAASANRVRECNKENHPRRIIVEDERRQIIVAVRSLVATLVSITHVSRNAIDLQSIENSQWDGIVAWKKCLGGLKSIKFCRANYTIWLTKNGVYLRPRGTAKFLRSVEHRVGDRFVHENHRHEEDRQKEHYYTENAKHDDADQERLGEFARMGRLQTQFAASWYRILLPTSSQPDVLPLSQNTALPVSSK